MCFGEVFDASGLAYHTKAAGDKWEEHWGRITRRTWVQMLGYKNGEFMLFYIYQNQEDLQHRVNPNINNGP